MCPKFRLTFGAVLDRLELRSSILPRELSAADATRTEARLYTAGSASQWTMEVHEPVLTLAVRSTRTVSTWSPAPVVS